MSIQLRPAPHTTAPEHSLHPGDLASLIADYGIGRFEPEVATAAEVAAEHGAPDRLVRIVRDSLTPEVVRERAFGRIAAYLPIR
jgi:hypothetical protein